jgi:uncharacterized protein (TIGR00299 family) protein
MHIGALVDLGVPGDYLKNALDKLPLANEFTLVLEPGKKMGITGTKATVQLHSDAKPPARHLADITALIDEAGYSPAVSDLGKGIFHELAVAEAKIHGTSIDRVHFHEVGATDSIVDIVAAALCIDYLAVDAIHCGTVEVGGGMVKCAHGLMPVPAPATAELLREAPCHYGRVDAETTTPTGAAILKRAVDQFGPPSQFTVAKIGYGIGQKDFAIPNVLRVMLGESAASTTLTTIESATNLEIECNIDDMSAEAFQPLLTELLNRGAVDVFFTPIVMKKSRPATKVTVLTTETTAEDVIEALFNASTTIGVRTHRVEKRMLPRETRQLTTSHGAVQVKIVTLPDGRTRHKVEHDDIMRLAAQSAMDYLPLKALIDAEVAAQLKP